MGMSEAEMSEAEMSEAETSEAETCAAGAREAARLATLAQFPVGAVWRYMGQVRHIRAVVDDLQFVYRVWNKHRGRWVYSVEYWHMLWLDMQEQAR